MAANLISSTCEFTNTDSFYYKLGGTTAVNMTLGILKDRYFAQKFSNKPISQFPLRSWGMFVIRDVFTIGAGFSFPPILSSYLLEKSYVSKTKTAQDIAQFASHGF